jgi:membrane protein YdbS with pleckstrin-like domain
VTFDVGVRLLTGLAILGIVVWVLVRPQEKVAANLGARFAKRSRAWVSPQDVAEVDAVLMSDLRARGVLLAVVGIGLVLAWPDLEPGWTLLALAALLALGLQVLVERQVAAFRGWRCFAGVGDPEPVADFLGPVQRAVLWLAPPAAAYLLVSASEVEMGCAVGAGTWGLAGYAWWQQRRVLRLRFEPRDDNQAYLVDAMRALLLGQHLAFLAPVVVVAIVASDIAIGEYGPLIMAVLAVAIVGLIVELRRPPRFRRRRWPRLVEQQVVLNDGRPYPWGA